MFNINSEKISQMLGGAGCLAAAVWLVIQTNEWVARTWYTSDGSLTLPVMSALMAATLIATGFASILRLNANEPEEYPITPEEMSREPLYEN